MRRTFLPFALLLVAGLAAPARAEDPPAEKKKHGVRASDALNVVERHAVTVHLRFQKDLDAEEHGAVPPNPGGVSESFRLWRMSYVVPGFVVKDRRTVLISDVWVSQGAIASVAVKPLTGTPVPGRLRGFLKRGEAVVVETESDLPVEPVVFGPEASSAAPEAALVGSVAEGARGIESWVDGLGTVRRRVGSAKLAFGGVDAPTDGISQDQGTRTIDLVLGPGATPIGFRFGGGMDVDDGIWRGPDVLADAEIPFPSLKERARALAQKGTRARVEVTFRTTKRDDAEDQGFGRFDASGGEGRLEHWGFAVAPDLLVVPGRIEPDAVRRIESVRWKVDDGPGAEAQYAGKVRGYDAYLVRVPSAKFEPLAEEQPKVPGIGQAILVHRTAWRGGERRDQLDYNRVMGWGRRYGDRQHWALEREVDEGALLLDLDGRVLGVAARIDPLDKEQRMDDGGFSRRARREFPLMAVLFEEVGVPSTLAKDPDTRIMPQEETESKRLPWLGVETTGFTKVVAEMLDISKPTRDGNRGLLVGRVYPGSPAARAGIEVGDILLTVKVTSGPGAGAPAVDLVETGGGGWSSWRFFMDMDDEAPQPWKSQDTPMHQLFKKWGEGTTFDLQYLSKKELKTASLKVEIGPPTFDSAPRKKDDGTGLTVRDMTYEVRAALRLPQDAAGVVVARVEPGSPAAQTRIGKNELVQEVEGRHVVDVGTFVALLEEARAQGKENVRVVVRRLDKTRLVDLGLAPKDIPADDKPVDLPPDAPADHPNGER